MSDLLTIETHDGQPGVLKLSGRLNTSTASELERVLTQTLEQTGDIELDCSALEYLSSAGLRVLVGTHKRAVAAGGGVKLVSCTPDVREVFEITGLIDIFEVS